MAKEKKEKAKQSREEKKIKKALKCLRFRNLKNFFIWLMGVLIMPFILVATMFVGLKVIPLSTYFGGKEQTYVSEEIASKSLIDALMGFESYTYDDIAFIDQLIKEIQATDIGDGKTLGEWIEIDTEQLKGTKITELANVLQNCIKVNATLENTVGTDMLKDFNAITAFNEWEPVSELPESTAADFNPNLYWYFVEETGAAVAVTASTKGSATPEGPDGKEGEWVLAYEKTNNGYSLKPGATIYNICYANLSQIPITMAVDLIDESLSRLKINDVLELAGIKREVDEETNEEKPNLILDLLDGKSISDFSGEFKAEDLLGDLTLESLGGASLLGDLGGLSAFSVWEEVKEEDKPLVGTENIIEDDKNAKLYYYLPGGITPANATDEDYVRVFNDEGVSCLDGDAYKDAKLYYAKLSAVPFFDMAELLSESIGRIKVKDLLGNLGGATFEDGSLMDKILGDKTVSEMGSIGTEKDPILLCWVLPFDTSTKETYKILISAIYGIVPENDEDLKARAEKLSVSDLTLDFNAITLETVLPRKDENGKALNEDLYKILDDLAMDVNGDGAIQISELSSGFSLDKLALNTVLPKSENADLYEILEMLITPSNSDKGITVKDLSGALNFGNVKLSKVMKDLDQNDALVKILTKAADVSWDDMTIDHVTKKFDVNKIILADVMTTVDKDDSIAQILVGATGVAWDEITIANICDKFNINNVLLKDVLGETVSDTLKKILTEALGDYGTITVGNLSSGTFSLDKVSLKTAMGSNYNATLFNILKQATNKKSEDEIKISDLKNFSFTNVTLNSVITESTDNSIIDLLIKDNTVTVGNIGEKINGLSVADIYNVNCFTTEKNNGSAAYYWRDGKYVHSSKADPQSGEQAYYVSKDANIWLFLLYKNEKTPEGETIDSCGNAYYYVSTDLKFGSMSSAVINMSGSLLNASIRQLCDAGIIDGDMSLIQSKTINEILKSANNVQIHN